MTRTSIVALGLTLLLGASCSRTTEVEVTTWVGAPHTRDDPEARRENAAAVLAAALPAWLREAGERARHQHTEATTVTHPPTNADELASLIETVRTGPLDDLGGPARRIAAADPAVWPQIREALLAERKAPKGDYRSVLDAIGGDVPNRYGHFARAWKRAHGYRNVKLSTDWFEDLLALPRGKVAPMLLPVYRDCVLQTALLHAASQIGRVPHRTADVVDTLLETAYAHQGTFRDEVGRAIVAIGDEAVPHLIRRSVPPPDAREDDPAVQRAAYARVQLDAMDRFHPLRATEAVHDDPRLLAAVLSAYGEVKPGDAADVLLQHADNPTPAVREAARRAFEAYVTGPPPKANRKTVRLIGGGTGQALASLTYRQRAAMSIRERLGREALVLLEPPCDPIAEDGTPDAVCEGQPARLTRAYFAWLDLRREIGEREAIDRALAAPDPRVTTEMLDRLLAIDPGLRHADRLVPFYRQEGRRALANRDLARAAQQFRKAAMLLPPDAQDDARRLRVQALLAEAAVPQLDPAGRHMLLRTAGELAPEDERIQALVGKLETPSVLPPDPEPRRRFWAGLALVVALWTALLAARHVTRARACKLA